MRCTEIVDKIKSYDDEEEGGQFHCSDLIDGITCETLCDDKWATEICSGAAKHSIQLPLRAHVIDVNTKIAYTALIVRQREEEEG